MSSNESVTGAHIPQRRKSIKVQVPEIIGDSQLNQSSDPTSASDAFENKYSTASGGTPKNESKSSGGTPKNESNSIGGNDIPEKNFYSELIHDNIAIWIFCFIIGVIGGTVIIYVIERDLFGLSDATNSATLQKCTQPEFLFPDQKSDMWDSLESGINEVKDLNKPSTFLYVYTNATEQYVNNFLNKAANYAGCILNENQTSHIEITTEELTSPKALADYGYLIDKYKEALENKSVMIVKHLEKVPGVVAQAFHTFCDEFTPLVPKSTIIFSMKVENYEELNYRLIEEILKLRWKDLDEDKFNPLLVRISSMIVGIDPC